MYSCHGERQVMSQEGEVRQHVVNLCAGVSNSGGWSELPTFSPSTSPIILGQSLAWRDGNNFQDIWSNMTLWYKYTQPSQIYLLWNVWGSEEQLSEHQAWVCSAHHPETPPQRKIPIYINQQTLLSRVNWVVTIFLSFFVKNGLLWSLTKQL